MDKISNLLKQQLSELEAVVYLLVNSGMGHRDLARRLGMSHYYVNKTYDQAKSKVEKLRKAKMYD